MASLQDISVTWDERDRPVINIRYADDADAFDADPNAWLTVLAERLPDRSAQYLLALIELNESRDHVSFGTLANDLNVDKKDVEGWNRNLGRSIKAVVRDEGFLRPEQEDGTAQLFDLQWDQPNNMWLYAVPQRYRATLQQALGQR